jgi:hypothetical protein
MLLPPLAVVSVLSDQPERGLLCGGGAPSTGRASTGPGPCVSIVGHYGQSVRHAPGGGEGDPTMGKGWNS